MDYAANKKEFGWAAELQRQRVRELRFAHGEVVQLAQSLAARLNQLIEDGHDVVAFGAMLCFAILKDFLDILLAFFLIGSIPIIGAIPGMFLSALIFYFLWGKGYFLRGRIRAWRWVLGFFIDSLPVFNALPINTLMVLYAWHIVRKRGGKARKALESLKNATHEELREIDREFE